MKNIFRIAVIGLTLMTISCTNQTESKENPESVKNTYNIELANNEKWEVNKEMMVHIKNMESDIEAVSNQSSPNYEELGSKLDENIGLLTSNCAMTGKAHDELHKWLLPFIDLVKELNAADSKEDQKQSFEAIQESMNEFNTYFK
ncbi:hypothetical protein SAMN05216474_2123 [Lishizhenia tianjinensis]|uniref:Lipoprotein n=1 Tax=Lishizhenia tianjinensis TaxID=477690 RepID=A0A1I7AID1_9FLAO|nr:hypothetical protein [Lishizhenia tianjinensis]SFT74709.1 hypothetical protein SAMN05216474_2123 [Lishizhenia tianjinensis]